MGPAGTLVKAEQVDDLETLVLCGSSSEREKEADVLVNDSHVSVNGGGALVSAAVKVAVGDLVSVFAANSGYASSERGSCLTWSFLCWIYS